MFDWLKVRLSLALVIVDWIRTKLMVVISYIKPIDLGIHDTLSNSVKDDPISTDQLMQVIDKEVNRAIAERTSHKFTTINMDKTTLVGLNSNIGDFTISAILVSDKANNSIVKLKHIKTNKVIRISMNTFRLFFRSK